MPGPNRRVEESGAAGASASPGNGPTVMAINNAGFWIRFPDLHLLDMFSDLRKKQFSEERHGSLLKIESAKE